MHVGPRVCMPHAWHHSICTELTSTDIGELISRCTLLVNITQYGPHCPGHDMVCNMHKAKALQYCADPCCHLQLPTIDLRSVHGNPVSAKQGEWSHWPLSCMQTPHTKVSNKVVLLLQQFAGWRLPCAGGRRAVSTVGKSGACKAVRRGCGLVPGTEAKPQVSLRPFSAAGSALHMQYLAGCLSFSLLTTQQLVHQRT